MCLFATSIPHPHTAHLPSAFRWALTTRTSLPLQRLWHYPFTCILSFFIVPAPCRKGITCGGLTKTANTAYRLLRFFAGLLRAGRTHSGWNIPSACTHHEPAFVPRFVLCADTRRTHCFTVEDQIYLDPPGWDTATHASPAVVYTAMHYHAVSPHAPSFPCATAAIRFDSLVRLCHLLPCLHSGSFIPPMLTSSGYTHSWFCSCCRFQHCWTSCSQLAHLPCPFCPSPSHPCPTLCTLPPPLRYHCTPHPTPPPHAQRFVNDLRCRHRIILATHHAWRLGSVAFAAYRVPPHGVAIRAFPAGTTCGHGCVPRLARYSPARHYTPHTPTAPWFSIRVPYWFYRARMLSLLLFVFVLPSGPFSTYRFWLAVLPLHTQVLGRFLPARFIPCLRSRAAHATTRWLADVPSPPGGLTRHPFVDRFDPHPTFACKVGLWWVDLEPALVGRARFPRIALDAAWHPFRCRFSFLGGCNSSDDVTPFAFCHSTGLQTFATQHACYRGYGYPRPKTPRATRHCQPPLVWFAAPNACNPSGLGIR